MFISVTEIKACSRLRTDDRGVMNIYGQPESSVSHIVVTVYCVTKASHEQTKCMFRMCVTECTLSYVECFST